MNRFGFACSILFAFEEPPEGARPNGSGRAVVTVALSTFTPVGDVVPKGASRVPMLRLDFAATCDRDVTVEDVTLTDYGQGLVSDVVGIWLSHDQLRRSGSRRLQTDKTTTVRFIPPLIVPACETVAVDVFAAFARSALEKGRHTLVLGWADDVVADARVEGAFPITGETFAISTQETGAVTVTYLPVTVGALIGGSERQIIGAFSVEVDTVEDQILYAMTLENIGQAQDGEFVAIHARAASGRARFTTLAPETYGDRVTIPFDPPYIVRKGGRVDFQIIADVVDGTGATIIMRFEDPSDFFSVGSLYGYGDNGQLYGSRVTVEGSPGIVRIR